MIKKNKNKSGKINKNEKKLEKLIKMKKIHILSKNVRSFIL